MMMTRKRTIGLLLIACLLTVGIASVYAKGGAQGKPFDELWTHIFNTDTRVDELETKIAQLEDLIKSIPAGPQGPKGDPGATGPKGDPGFFGKPDYDSGWVDIAPEQLITLHLGDKYELSAFVYVLGKGDLGTDKITTVHQMFLGGEIVKEFTTAQVGLIWGMTEEEDGDVIKVHRCEDDTFWEQVRVRVWKLPKLED